MGTAQIKSDSLTDREKLAWIRLARSENVGPITFYQLLEKFGSASDAIDNIADLAKKAGRSKPIQVQSESQAHAEIQAHRKLKAHLIFSCEPSYPSQLKTIADAPPVLSVLGQQNLIHTRSIGVVGARNASLVGKKFAENVSRDLGQAGWTIVSGLARGIDTHAHKGSLGTGTVAVLAGGVDHIYPPENQSLYEAIAESGTILSEAPIGITPKSHYFPRRNRLISGLSTGVVVVEAAHKSGSLITAKMALEQGREVFAVPGSPYDPRHQGCNALIAQGATLIQGANDVIEGVISHLPVGTLHETPEPYHAEPKKIWSQETTDNQRDSVLENLSNTPVGLDELARQCQMCPQELMSLILELELAGKVLRTSGNKVALGVE